MITYMSINNSSDSSDSYISNDEYDATNININDYEYAHDVVVTEDYKLNFKEHIDLMNMFKIYHDKTFNTQNYSILSNIDTTNNDSSNSCVEFMRSEVYAYANSKHYDKDVLYDMSDNININKYETFYCLIINNVPKYMCVHTLPIIKYLVTRDHALWDIIDLKL